jgi:primosomal protein N' (replication factor Y) (superfamily II helicase)
MSGQPQPQPPSPVTIEVAMALPVQGTYTYSVPTPFLDQLQPGKRTLVPFGRRRVTGYVLGVLASPDAGLEIKAVLDILDERPLFPADMIPFFRWVADYYLHPLGEVIKAALPQGINLCDRAALSLTPEGQAALAQASLPPLTRQVLERISQRACQPKDLVRSPGSAVPAALLHALSNAGWVTRTRVLKRPATGSRTERFVTLAPAAQRADLTGLTPKRRQLLEAVAAAGEISSGRLGDILPGAARLLGPLVHCGLLQVTHKTVHRDPFGEAIQPDRPRQLTDEQAAAVTRVETALAGGFAAFLLAGVTGSGKTEVYLQLAAQAVSRGRTALILVPEIALISQTERRFRARFGERVAVLHSGLSAGERFDQWRRIVQGETPIVIGARSAIFAPLQDLGLIVVDEEHDNSYKQDHGLRYHARDLALVRAKQAGCVALLGSATPSVQSWHNAESGKFEALRLSRRVENRSLPEITVVDLTETRDARGIRRFISPTLEEAIAAALVRNQQVLLFLNRRGFASLPICAACGEALKCANCDITLTYHRHASAYRCHYCGYSRSAAACCPLCGSARIKLLGLGTEKVAEGVATLFPEARVARMDRDTTGRKGETLKLLKGLRDGTIDVLVGTQMVAKGHDFPNITLVGIICADMSLSFPDFRAGEQTFQILAQVAGRAGRGGAAGRVILQTYTPGHFSIVAARQQDFDLFYRREIGHRRGLNYPPFARLVQLRISGRHKERTADCAAALGEICRRLSRSDEGLARAIEVLGPIEAPLARIARRYRWQILVKGLGAGPLRRFLRLLTAEPGRVLSPPQVRVAVDVDPVFML